MLEHYQCELYTKTVKQSFTLRIVSCSYCCNHQECLLKIHSHVDKYISTQQTVWRMEWDVRVRVTYWHDLVTREWCEKGIQCFKYECKNIIMIITSDLKSKNQSKTKIYRSAVLYFTDPIRCERLCLHLLTSSLLLFSRSSFMRIWYFSREHSLHLAEDPL